MPRAFNVFLVSASCIILHPSRNLLLLFVTFLDCLCLPKVSFFLPLCLLYTVQYSFASASASAIILTYYLLIINSSGRIVTESDSACNATGVGRLFLGVGAGKER
jgi:hypothetical protein